jgi:hypothetical protein
VLPFRGEGYFYLYQIQLCHPQFFSRQFTNAIYVLGADSSSPAAIYLYDATAKSWSKQAVDPGDKFDPTNFGAILDHDTNVFCALALLRLQQPYSHLPLFRCLFQRRHLFSRYATDEGCELY